MAMGSFFVRQQILRIVSGAEGLANNIAQSDIRELVLFIPSIEEQGYIADFLVKQTQKIDRLAKLAKDTISLLRERRAALIAAAVSGQIEVTG
jgi:type I restriction enzyme S subunit